MTEREWSRNRISLGGRYVSPPPPFAPLYFSFFCLSQPKFRPPPDCHVLLSHWLLLVSFLDFVFCFWFLFSIFFLVISFRIVGLVFILFFSYSFFLFFLCVLFYSFDFFFSFGQAQKVAIEEELAQTLQGLRNLTLRVEASERYVRLVLPAKRI